jgi:hypothetical protein
LQKNLDMRHGRNFQFGIRFSESDRIIPPDVQRMFADRINVTSLSLNVRHASLVSHPNEIAELILNATKGSKLSIIESIYLVFHDCNNAINTNSHYSLNISSTKHHFHFSPGSYDLITGCPLEWKCFVPCLLID